jgi:hypothetical protein
MAQLAGEDYRRGAIERLDDARLLLRAGQFAGAVSDAGRSVEGMLRAVLWKRDADIRRGRKSLETGHDLRQLLVRVRDLGLLPDQTPRGGALETDVQRIGQLWFNNLRFVSSQFLQTRWYNIGEIRRGRTLKQAAEQFYFACEAVVKRCEVLCQK